MHNILEYLNSFQWRGQRKKVQTLKTYSDETKIKGIFTEFYFKIQILNLHFICPSSFFLHIIRKQINDQNNIGKNGKNIFETM